MPPLQSIEFLGCLVENFSCSLGFNSAPSTLDVTLVEDPDSGLGGYQADSFSDVGSGGEFSLKNQMKAGTGGTRFAGGNPGQIVTFETPDGNFKFTGIITSYKRTNNTSGRKINVRLADLRILMKNIPVLSKVDWKSLEGHAGQNNFDSDNHNVIDAYGTRGRNAIGANWTTEGMRTRDILATTDDKVFYINGTSFRVQYPTSKIFKSLPHQVNFNSRTAQHSTTLTGVLDSAGKVHNFDWYIDTEIVFGTYFAKVYAIPRRNQPNIFGDDNSVSRFVTANQSDLISFNVGRELRDGANETIVIGDNRRTTWQAQNGTSICPIVPVFGELGDGELSERLFVDLSNIWTSDNSLLNQLPVLVTETKRLTTTIGSAVIDNLGLSYIEEPLRTKTRQPTGKSGYITTLEVLRAALHSKESWETAVYYEHGVPEFTFTYRISNDYDQSSGTGVLPLGKLVESTVSIQASVANAMGIWSPPWNRDEPDNPFLAATNVDYLDEWHEALKDSCYQATKKHAEKYFGKKFLVTLPPDINYDEILDYSSSSSMYRMGDRDILSEYDICDASPMIFDTWGTTEGSVPGPWRRSDNRAFVDRHGMYKPTFMISGSSMHGNIYNLDAYSHVSYEGFSEDKVVKYSNYDLETEVNSGNGHFFATTDISVKRYQYDPRFAILDLNGHINLGYGKIRDIQTTKATSGPDQGRVTDYSVQSVAATAPSEKDQSGGTQEMISWMYRGYDIVVELKDSSGNRVSVIPSSNFGYGSIDAAVYEKLIRSSSKHLSEQIGFEQKRWTGVATGGVDNQLNYHQREPVLVSDSLSNGEVSQAGYPLVWIPLKWNFIHYGPWVFGDWGYPGRSAQVIEDRNLNPWNYGNYSTMTSAGNLIASNATSQTHTTMMANVTLNGTPQLILGDQPGNEEQTEIDTNLSSISTNYSAAGAKTTYNFKTYFGPVGFVKRDEIDRINFSHVESDKSKKDIINLDDIQRTLGKDGDNDKGGNPFTTDGSSGASTSSKAQQKSPTVSMIAATTADGSKGQPSVTLTSSRGLVEALHSRPDTYVLGGFEDGMHYASVNELFFPITTAHPTFAFGFSPSQQGIPLGETEAATGEET